MASWLIFAILSLIESCESAANLHLLDNRKYPGARCLDGSPSGFYFDPATRSDSRNFVIHLQGGGECASKESCTNKLSGSLGSSKTWPSSMGLGFLMHPDCHVNPDFCTWNRILVAYCSQDLHMGTVTTPSNSTWGLYFAGHVILEAVLSTLEEIASMREAKSILLSGDSAGGIGTWPHMNWLASKYLTAEIRAVPIAGFYSYAYPYEGPGHTASGLVDFREAAWPGHVALWEPFLDPTCRTALHRTPWACALANYSHPFVNIPVFVVEAQTDAVVLTAHDWVPNQYPDRWTPPVIEYLYQWSVNMTAGLEFFSSLNYSRSYFNPACFLHTEFTDGSPLVSGVSYRTAIGEWLRGRKVSFADCCVNGSVLCNPTCPVFP